MVNFNVDLFILQKIEKHKTEKFSNRTCNLHAQYRQQQILEYCRDTNFLLGVIRCQCLCNQSFFKFSNEF